MAQIHETIEIHAPVEKVYDEWSDLTRLPQILTFIKEVRIIDPVRSHWKLEIAGQEKEYEAVLSEEIANSRLSWSSDAGVENSGTVSFQSLGDNKAQLDVKIFWEPEGVIENIGDFTGAVAAAARHDLEEFKDRIEKEDNLRAEQMI